jgi:hypothetical protein
MYKIAKINYPWAPSPSSKNRYNLLARLTVIHMTSRLHTNCLSHTIVTRSSTEELSISLIHPYCKYPVILIYLIKLFANPGAKCALPLTLISRAIRSSRSSRPSALLLTKAAPLSNLNLYFGLLFFQQCQANPQPQNINGSMRCRQQQSISSRVVLIAM